MKKSIVLIAAIGLCFLMVAPAMADHKIGGYYRMQMVADTAGGAPAKDKHSENVIDHRFRLKFVNTLNDDVILTYFGEVDTPWGESSKGAIGGGGKVGADGVNIETKHANLFFNVPDTPLSFTTGIQGFGGRFDSALVNDDMAGALMNAKFDMVNVGVGYFVWDEADRYKDDDVIIYAAVSDFTISEAFKLKADIYGYQDKSAGDSVTNINWLGVGADFKAESFGVSAWVLLEGGEVDNDTGADADLGGLAASVRATMKFGSVDAAARMMYYMADDDKEDDMAFKGGYGAFEYHIDNLMIFLTDIYYNNTAGGRHALTDAAYAGYGLIGATMAANVNLTETVYAKFGAGFFMAADDQINEDESTKKEGSVLGEEIAAMIGVKVAEKVDISVRGAYALVGDFYEVKGGGDDPDNMYKGCLMINVGY